MNDVNPAPAALAIENVSVRYDERVVLEGVSLNIPRGSVYALLGRNGAGKSSLIRCSLGLQKPTGGCVRIFGEDSWAHRARLLERAAYVPETSDAPSSLRVRDVVRFHQSVSRQWDEVMLAKRVERAGIDLRSGGGSLSKGQRSLFSLALALASKPELLVLDDPTLGLDIVARNEFFTEIVGDLADRETTVFLTTHDLSGVEGIADRVGILRGTKLALDRSVEELKSERGQSLEEIFTEVTKAA